MPAMWDRLQSRAGASTGNLPGTATTTTTSLASDESEAGANSPHGAITVQTTTTVRSTASTSDLFAASLNPSLSSSSAVNLTAISHNDDAAASILTPPPPLASRLGVTKARSAQSLAAAAKSQRQQTEFDRRIDALGIAEAPKRLEIRKGKTVPQPHPGQISSPPDLDLDANDEKEVKLSPFSFAEPPPRNPRRVQQLQKQQQRPRISPRTRSDPTWRPASSIYPDDENLDFLESPEGDYLLSSSFTSYLQGAPANMAPRPALALDQISPPSSPELGALPGGYADDVSPIDEGLASFAHQLAPKRPSVQPQQSQLPPQQNRSNIPMLRREARKNQQSSNSVSRATENASSPSMADPGDDSDRRRAPTESPVPSQGQDWAIRSETPDDGQPLGLTTTISGPRVDQSGKSSPSFGQRVRQLGRGKAVSVESRPAWNGASGREKVITPVRDDPRRLPRPAPIKKTKKAGSTGNASLPSAGPSGMAVTGVRKFLPAKSEPKDRAAPKASSQPVPILQTKPPANHNYPSPPYTDSPVQMVAPSPEPIRNSAAPRLTPENVPPTDKAIKRKPPPSTRANASQHAPHFSTSSSIYSSQPEHAPVTPRVVTSQNLMPDDPWTQPPSRFSITTYATSTAESPRQSLEEQRPPLPTPPAPFSSVMERKRPVRGGDSSPFGSDGPVVISMKNSNTPQTHGDIAKASHMRSAASVDTATRDMSRLSTGKALPPAPPEVSSANDRVAYLQARLEAIANRKHNIDRSIKQMTDFMPSDNLMANDEILRKRELEKKKVEVLREELSELLQEEHDLGLKLHRAYKRLASDGDYESSTLWVRRVTG